MKLTSKISRAVTVGCVAGVVSLVSALAFGQAVRILEDDIPHAAPFFADVDGDGLKDLLVGQYQDDPYTGARVRLFRNIGTAESPKFAGGEFLQAGTADASCREFCHTGFGPQIVDFDGDGLRDLITGSRDCELFVFPGRKSGEFDAAIRINYVKDERASLKFRYNLRLYAHDWDSDGDLDLLAARNQAVWLIRNDGDSKMPQFATPIELVVKGADEAYLRVPFVADWNNDGRDDLILGRSDGSVVWLQNTAQCGTEPKLAASVVLVEPGVSSYVTMDDDGHYDRPPAPTQDIRLCVVDYNNDGQLDLLLGDRWFLQGAKSNRSDEQAARRVGAYSYYSALRAQLEALQETPQDEAKDARTAREAKIATKKAECAIAWRAAYLDGRQYSRHGSVWLFERSVLMSQ